MNSTNSTKFKSAQNLNIDNISSIPKKRTIDLIKEYLNSQPDQIEKLQTISKSIYEVMSQFIQITKNYSSQLENLAMQIIPNYTTEGQLAQAVQGILLFYSENLNILINELSKKNEKTEENENIMIKFNEYKKSYFMKIKNVIFCHEKYKKEIELYQEFLVNEEFKEHMNKGDLRNMDDEIPNININIKESHIKDEKEERKESSDDNSNCDKKDENNFLKGFNPFDGIYDKDNQKDVIESNKTYLSNLNESNDIYNNIKDFLSKEKTNLRKNIFNVCVCLIDGLLKCVKNQKENYDIQKEVIKNLTNTIKFEETDKNKIRPNPHKLKYLEIYENYILEKNDLTPKKQNLTTDDLNKNKNNSFNSDKKNLNAGIIKLDTDNPIKNTVSYNNKENKLNIPQKSEKFKYMVKKLNRVEILDIFEKIKNTNILISEHDSKIIEEEKNYKQIKDILVLIFNDTEKYTENDKNILINFFMKDKKYTFYFIKVLNDHRTKGNFLLSEKTFKYLGELFKYINDLILSINDMDLFKYIFILSMTYYHVSKSEDLKIYLFSYIKDHPDYQKEKFWQDYLNELIEHDLKGANNQDIDLSNSDISKLNRDQKEKLNNCYFSNFLTAVKAMADFRMDKKFVRDFVEKNKDKYILTQDQIENVCMIYDISLKENEANYNGDFLNEKKQDELNNKDNKDKVDNIKLNNENKPDQIEKKENEIIDNDQQQIDKINSKENNYKEIFLSENCNKIIGNEIENKEIDIINIKKNSENQKNEDN